LHALALAPLYSPALQPAHAELPDVGWCWPASHASQYVIPVAGCFLPMAHCAHDVWAVAGWYDPGAHSTHALLPAWSWYAPLAQAAHDAAPLALDRPTVQFVHRTEPNACSLCCPAAQASHCDCAAETANLPPSHCLHAPALAPL